VVPADTEGMTDPATASGGSRKSTLPDRLTGMAEWNEVRGPGGTLSPTPRPDYGGLEPEAGGSLAGIFVTVMGDFG